jgi:hypothetical protein
MILTGPPIQCGWAADGPPLVDGLQTLLSDSTARLFGKAYEVRLFALIGLTDSRRAVTERSACCPQIAPPALVAPGSQMNRSMSMVEGMAWGMHQFAFEGGL